MGFLDGIWKGIEILLGKGKAPTVRPLTSGRAVLRVSGVERVPFGNGPGELDNWVVLTMLWHEGLAEGPALELALRGVDDAVATGKPVGSKVGLVARWSPNLAADNRLYHENKLRPEGDYLGEGTKYTARLPLGTPKDGGYLITVDWNREGVMISTAAGGHTILKGKHPEAAAFGWYSPAALGIGWGSAAQSAVNKGLKVELVSWTAVGPQPERIIVT